jgi:hypothetical protein
MDHDDIIIELPELRKRSPMVVAIQRRHGRRPKVMRDRRERRMKDARRHWSKEQE